MAQHTNTLVFHTGQTKHATCESLPSFQGFHVSKAILTTNLLTCFMTWHTSLTEPFMPNKTQSLVPT